MNIHTLNLIRFKIIDILGCVPQNNTTSNDIATLLNEFTGSFLTKFHLHFHEK